jgi:3-hydroxyisobutyrate dehydrogenase-like beta-hydroxyacid dehydrogenase
MPNAVGFVGLGSIGLPLVDSMVRAGLAPMVFDLDPAPVARVVASGGRAATSLPALAEQADVVGICVPADEHVRAVLDGRDGLLAHLRPGSVVAIHSTVLPETIRWAAASASTVSVGVVEAPITGGPVAAAEGRATFLLAGEPEHIEAIEPILAACGRVRVMAGALGNANLLKLCINLQSYVTLLGVFEAASMAKRLGVPIDGLKTAMQANGQLGEITANYFTLHELTHEAFADDGLRDLLSRNAAIVAKDLRLIASVADGVGHPVPAARLAGERVSDVYFLG